MRKLICFLLIAATGFSAASCVTTRHHDNGKHKGWFKNPRNPHHPLSDKKKKKKKPRKPHKDHKFHYEESGVFYLGL